MVNIFTDCPTAGNDAEKIRIIGGNANSSNSRRHQSEIWFTPDGTNGGQLEIWTGGIVGSRPSALSWIFSPRIYNVFGSTGGHLLPATTNTVDIGNSSFRVRTIYSNNALNTSDYNLKKDFTLFNTTSQVDQAVNAIMDTDMVLYRFDHENATETNQTLGFVLNDTRENGYYTDPFFKARTDDQSYNIMHVVGTLMAANKRAYSIIQQLVKIVKDNNLDTQSLPLDDMIPQD